MVKALLRTAMDWADPFRGIAADPALLAQGRALPAAHLRYALFFMPRTSSTRLTHLIRAAGPLGDPEEWFGTGIVRHVAPQTGAANRADYVDQLIRRKTQGGVFGTELTWLQMMVFFRSGQRCMQMLAPDRLIWLIRRDIVAQAVSAVRMVQTGVTQSVQADAAARQQAEAMQHYDAAAIRRQLLRLLIEEDRVDRLLSAQDRPLLRLDYEWLVGNDPAVVLSHIAAFLQVPLPATRVADPGHIRLSGDKSRDHALRFRAEHPRLCGWIDRRRAPRLAALSQNGH